jgi:phage terminase large subunit
MVASPRQATSPRYIAPFAALPWQVPPWRDTSSVVLLTGSAGGGKSRVAAEKLHGFCLKYPGAMALVLRKVKVSMTSGAVLMIARKIIGDDRNVRHLPSKSRFEYRNGSILAYAGLEDESQRDRLKSIGQDGAVDIAWMEEATEFEEADFNALLARMRGKAAPWRQIILSTNPDTPLHWIYRRLMQNHEANVYYSAANDNPYNPNDYATTLAKLTGVDADRLVAGKWVQATGLIFDVWLDAGDDGNVTEAAEYVPGGGRLLWAVDDGYAGAMDETTKTFTAESHPRAFLLCQQRPTGQLCVFAESYAIKTLEDDQIADVLDMPYPKPDAAAVDKSAAQLKGRIWNAGIATLTGPNSVEESIKNLRRMLAADTNGVRGILVHPRCRHLRSEMASYRRDASGAIVKQFDHGVDALRYICWSLRYE